MSSKHTADEAERIDPRIARTHASVLAAARQLLLEEGWEHVTVANVANRSGYARSTLYRHWPNRLDLLRDAISEQARLSHTVPVGSARLDLVAELSAFVEALRETGLGHMVAAMAQMARTDAEWRQLNAAVHAEGTCVIRQILAQAANEGATPASLEPDDAISMLLGPLLHRFLFRQQELTDQFVQQVVDSVLATRP